MNMSLKALITTIAILGSSTAALAAPGSYSPEVRDHRTETTVIDHRGSIDASAQADIRFAPVGRPAMPVRPMPPVYQPVYQPVYAPVTLADNTQLNGRELIRVAQGSRTFSKLELRAEQGKTSIDKVIVTFGNGRSQTFALDTKLSKKQPTISLDLSGQSRSIQRIVLVGKSNGRNASLDVIAV
jgi:hypothetical protein